ncbi:MAG: hypothetical protein ACRDIV_14185 [Ktedonobacteraceae bacterium]
MSDADGGEQSIVEATKPQRTLWMLECRHGDYSQLIPIYALSEEDADELAEKYIRESDKRLRRVALTAFPDGFVISRSRLPGKA